MGKRKTLRFILIAISCALLGSVFSTRTLRAAQNRPIDSFLESENIKAVLAAVIARMRNRSLAKFPGIVFAPAAAQPSGEPGFCYRGFDFKRLKVNLFREVGNRKNTFAFSGEIYFENRSGFGAQALFATVFQLDGAGRRIIIEQLGTSPANVLLPRMEVFVVPLKLRALEQYEGAAQSFEFLYNSVRRQSLTNNRNPVSGRRQRYVISFFIMDRLPKSPRFTFQLSGLPADARPEIRSLSFNKWRLVLFAADLSISERVPTQIGLELLHPLRVADGRTCYPHATLTRKLTLSRKGLAECDKENNARPLAEMESVLKQRALAQRKRASAGRAARGSTAVPPPLPARTEACWYIGLNGMPDGPHTPAEITKMITTGKITRNTMLWREGMKEWREASRISAWQMHFQ